MSTGGVDASTGGSFPRCPGSATGQAHGSNHLVTASGMNRLREA
jgi:hypothetical protein